MKRYVIKKTRDWEPTIALEYKHGPQKKKVGSKSDLIRVQTQRKHSLVAQTTCRPCSCVTICSLFVHIQPPRNPNGSLNSPGSIHIVHLDAHSVSCPVVYPIVLCCVLSLGHMVLYLASHLFLQQKRNRLTVACVKCV